ncbi:MAG: MFS transporter [Planctomycetes bacterium]|nr:MFS transporter [Planctomycetota bacterium]
MSSAARTRRISQTRADLRASIADNATWAAHLGFGEYYLPAFMLLVGGGQVAAGLVATLPQLVGAVLQLAAPLGVRWFSSLKRWVVVCAALQAASFAPLFLAAMFQRMPVAALFVVAAFYWGTGMSAGPAWSTWMSALVPAQIRPRFFAIRTRFGNVTLLLGLLAAGSLLQAGDIYGWPYAAFAAIFWVACGLRVVSVYFLARQSDSGRQSDLRVVSPLPLLRRLRGGHAGALILYLLSISLAAWTAAPYFTPYMLDVLHFNYAEYVVLIAAMHSARILALPLLGSLAQKWGADRLLWIGGVAITPMAGIWVLSQNFWALLVFQILSGMAWAVFELAALLMTFETIRATERTQVLTLFNFLNALATSAGSLIGAAILTGLTQTDAGDATAGAAYQSLFIVSSILRALCLGLLFRIARSPFHPDPEQLPDFALRPADTSMYESIALRSTGMKQDSAGQTEENP